MKHRKQPKFSAIRQPLPVDEIQANARHGKTVSHLPETGELPIITLEKTIPKSDLHDM